MFICVYTCIKTIHTIYREGISLIFGKFSPEGVLETFSFVNEGNLDCFGSRIFLKSFHGGVDLNWITNSRLQESMRGTDCCNERLGIADLIIG